MSLIMVKFPLAKRQSGIFIQLSKPEIVLVGRYPIYSTIQLFLLLSMKMNGASRRVNLPLIFSSRQVKRALTRIAHPIPAGFLTKTQNQISLR